MEAPEHGRELRIALYSHDSLGLGHTRRNLAIAQALADGLPQMTGRRVSGLLITGERTAPAFRAPFGFDWVVLPGIRKGDGCYESRRLAVGTRRVLGIRSAVIGAALTSFRPHVVIVDRHALGVDGELAEPLRELRAVQPEARVVLGLREVLDTPAAVGAEWDAVGIDRIAELYDRIWVYGDRAVHDPLATGELPGALSPLVDFTGLLADGRRTAGRGPEVPGPFVVTMVGGGADGGALARAAAGAPVPAGLDHVVVTGPQMPAALRAEVEAAALPGTRVLSRVGDGLDCMTRARAVVSMGGYNSIAEVLSTRTPALVVPRTAPRAEQLIRARGLARAGAIDLLEPAAATPAAIGAWLADVTADACTSARQSSARSLLDLAGLDRVVSLASALCRADDPIRRSAGLTAPGVLHAAL